ncbi:MAG: hypothetical protein ABI415_07115 [Flavitalea sp.]
MMKIIKLGIISVIAFSLLLTAMSLLFPSQVRVSRAINISGSREDIRKIIRDVKNWPQWNVLYNDKVKVDIISSDSEMIHSRWQYRNNILNSSFRTEESANITVVQWYFDFKVKWYPWQKLGTMLFDKEFGTPMETSLHNLKKLMENSP